MVPISSFAQFNPKINSNYPILTNSQTSPMTQTKPYSNDSVALSNSPKEKSSKGWWIAGGVLAALTAGALILRGRMSAVKELAEHIDFKPAATIDEAKAFAKEHLGIRRFDIDDLEIANYVNEGFVEASNKLKGKLVLPNAVDTVKGDSDAIMNYGKNLLGERVIGINPKGASWDDLSKYLMDARSMKKQGLTPEQIAEQLNAQAQWKARYEKAGFVERANIAHQIEKVGAKAGFDKYHELYHELGHLQHEYTNPQQFKKWAKYTGSDAIDYMKKNQLNLPAEIKEHILALNKHKEVARIIGGYATAYPGEFVADMYAHMLSGKKLCPELMELYNKYGGPKIPA